MCMCFQVSCRPLARKFLEDMQAAGNMELSFDGFAALCRRTGLQAVALMTKSPKSSRPPGTASTREPMICGTSSAETLQSARVKTCENFGIVLCCMCFIPRSPMLWLPGLCSKGKDHLSPEDFLFLETDENVRQFPGLKQHRKTRNTSVMFVAFVCGGSSFRENPVPACEEDRQVSRELVEGPKCRI